jgi:hypothetical protein
MLRIDMAKVIYVDTDKVARHVYRSNHDKKAYNNDDDSDDDDDVDDDSYSDDESIEHVFEYESFESISNNLDAFMKKHGRKFLLSPQVSMMMSIMTS